MVPVLSTLKRTEKNREKWERQKKDPPEANLSKQKGRKIRGENLEARLGKEKSSTT